MYKILKSKDAISKAVNEATPTGNKLWVMKPKYKEVDEAVYLWVCMLRSLRNDQQCLPLSRGIIKTRALYLKPFKKSLSPNTRMVSVYPRSAQHLGHDLVRASGLSTIG